MADSPLSGLSAAGAFADADLLYIVQGGVSYKTTWGALRAAIAAIVEYPEVANYAALPAAASHTGEIYVCLASQGTGWLFTLKESGFYYSNGATWSRLGALPSDYFTDSVLYISDNADPTKVCKFELSSITTGNTRTLTVPDASGTIMLVGDAPANHASRHTNGTDDIQNATAAQKGLATATQITKLDGIEAGADVTDAGNVGSAITGATGKTTPVDADEISLIDSAAGNVLKKLTWANLKATLKTYFDTLYDAVASTVSQAEAEAGTATTVRNWTAERVAQAIAALGGGGGGFDIFSTSEVEVFSHFYGAANSFGWRATTIGAGGTNTTGANLTAGIMVAHEIRTGTTDNAGAYISMAGGATGSLLAMDGTQAFDWQTHIATGSSLATMRFRIGIVETNGVVDPVNYVGFRFDLDNTDTNFRAVARAASADTLGADSLGAPATNTAYWFRIWSTGAGEINFSINGGTTVTINSGLPSVRGAPSVILCQNNATDQRCYIEQSALAFAR